MANEIFQKFLKGINRRFPREESVSPEFFYTLQNARLFTRGDTGKIKRIKGNTQFDSTGNDYTNVVDSIYYEDQYIVLYEDASTSGTYHIDIFDLNGSLVTNFTYTGVSLAGGSLLKSDKTVFVSPHSKILYYDGSSWTFKDIQSTIPKIETIAQDKGNLASATIEPTSGVSNLQGRKSTASIKVLRNNVPIDVVDSVNITVGANTTDNIVIDYTMTTIEVAQEMYDALRGEGGYSNPGILTDWDISMIPSSLSGKSDTSTVIYFTNKTTGSSSDKISISSTYTIADSSGGSDGGRLTFIEDEFGFPVLQDITTLIRQPKGGFSGVGDIGPLYIYLENIGKTIKTENLTTSDTVSVLADKIETALDDDLVDFTVTRDKGGAGANHITIDSNIGGKKFNGEVLLKIKDPLFKNATEAFSYNKTNFSGGTDFAPDSGIESDVDYWYKARYKYIDGHIGATCFPDKFNSGPGFATNITFDTSETDLDGTRPKLQIFRKKEGENFFLVDEIDISADTTVYNDDGHFKKGAFEEIESIWTKNHLAQEIIDNRYVKANITYPTENYTDVNFILNTQTTSEDESLPNNSKARIFVQPQYNDGSKGYFTEIGAVNVTDPDKLLNVAQSTPLMSNSDKTISELGFYANYVPRSENFSYKFNSFELANSNIPTIEDENRYPSTTRILFGFKNIKLTTGDNGDSNIFSVYVNGWDTQGDETDHYGFAIKIDEELKGPIGESSAGADDGKFPRSFDIELLGRKFTYNRVATKTGQDYETAVYQLADFQALKEACQSGELVVRLINSPITTLSSTRENKEILETKVKVKNIIDKSEGSSNVSIQAEDDQVLAPASDTRIYLELEESILDEIDNLNVTNYKFRTDYGATIHSGLGLDDLTGFPTDIFPLESFTLGFELINFKKNSVSIFQSYTGDGSGNDEGRQIPGDFGNTFFVYDWDFAKYELLTLADLDNETGIFIGKKDNEQNNVTLDITGYSFVEEDSLFINQLREENIYANLTFKSDLNIDRTSFPQQIVWSEELNKGSGFSGGRDFRVESFFNMSDENGDIKELVSLNNKLFIFCETGVAVANIGEVLTTQSSGEVFVDSSRFITNYYWVNDKLINIKEKSIIKYKNVIYFTDGRDVYALSGNGLKNITNGVLDLDENTDYFGGINPKHDEYQLCDYDNNETWVYSLEFGQWYGPFTYKFKSSVYNDLVFITVDDVLYEQNTGNTFNGSTFTTKIESSADDTEASFYDKNFRKFYIGSANDKNTLFLYGKDPNDLKSRHMNGMITKNGYKHQGIDPKYSNSKSIFWTISSTDDGFELQDIGWVYNFKIRR